jgi:hypothetical protein
MLRDVRALAVVLAALLPAAVAVASCALEGFTVQGAAGAPPDAGPDAGAGGGVGAGGGSGGDMGCERASYPKPPSDVTLSGDETFTVALRSIDFGEKASAPPGLDIDDRCTCCCDDDGPSCLQPKESCDYDHGVDNAAAAIFKLIGLSLVDFSSEFFSTGAEQGLWSIVLRVRGYNGLPDDDQVELAWLMSSGLDAGDAGAGAPAWDGEDLWEITNESMVGPDGGAPNPAGGVEGNTPRFVDPLAYVTGGVLVASFPSAEMRVAGSLNSVVLRLTGGFLVARVEASPGVPGAYALADGLVVGKWRLEDVFLAISSYRSNDGLPVCTDDTAYVIGKQTICKSADVYAGTTTPTTPCDSLSLGVAFEASPARVGAIISPPGNPPGCPPETDPANDSCAPL